MHTLRFNLASRYKQQNPRQNEPEQQTERAKAERDSTPNGDSGDLGWSGMDWTEKGLTKRRGGATLSIYQSQETS